MFLVVLKYGKKSNSIWVLRDTYTNLILPNLKTGGEQHTLSERRKVCIYLCLSFIVTVIVMSSEKNKEICCSNNCSKTTEISCSGGRNKVGGLGKFWKTSWRRRATIWDPRNSNRCFTGDMWMIFLYSSERKNTLNYF